MFNKRRKVGSARLNIVDVKAELRNGECACDCVRCVYRLCASLVGCTGAEEGWTKLYVLPLERDPRMYKTDKDLRAEVGPDSDTASMGSEGTLHAACHVTRCWHKHIQPPLFRAQAVSRLLSSSASHLSTNHRSTNSLFWGFGRISVAQVV